jgi:hypothetical protein
METVQYAVVAVIVGLAANYLYVKLFKKKSCCGNGCQCGGKPR